MIRLAAQTLMWLFLVAFMSSGFVLAFLGFRMLRRDYVPRGGPSADDEPRRPVAAIEGPR